MEPENQDGHLITDNQFKAWENDPMMVLTTLLSHPEVRDNQRFIKEGEIEYTLAWIGLADHPPHDLIRLNLRQMGLWTPAGEIDKDRAMLISDYIWDRHPATPDYAQLLHWLEKNHPRDSVRDKSTPTNSLSPVSRTKRINKTDEKGKTAKAKKKKRIARKQARKNNRKRK